jgi:hypothetical protein
MCISNFFIFPLNTLHPSSSPNQLCFLPGFGNLSMKQSGLFVLFCANDVVTLALGSRPRQRLAKMRAKSVEECENEHSHSQVSSHFGS